MAIPSEPRAEIPRRFRPRRKVEAESPFQQPRGNHAAALEQQLRFGAMHERADPLAMISICSELR